MILTTMMKKMKMRKKMTMPPNKAHPLITKKGMLQILKPLFVKLKLKMMNIKQTSKPITVLHIRLMKSLLNKHRSWLTEN